MKKFRPFLTLCIAAMAIASVAGFISFRKAFNNGTLSNLYKEDKASSTSEHSLAATKPAVDTMNESKAAEVKATTTRNSRHRNKHINLKSFSRAEIEAPADTILGSTATSRQQK